ncbi:hypothetical protein [Reyranella sp.]|uniref:hypothetical protein n=1 Tax=Reyranella sp. TaxID=1929291 RepID=UPI003BAC431C
MNILKRIAALSFAVIGVVAVVTVVVLLTSREADIRLASALGFDAAAKRIKDASPESRPPHLEESGRPEWTDHYSIVRRILECTGTESISKVEFLPLFVGEMYTENPRLWNRDKKTETMPNGQRAPTTHERGYMELSRVLANQRTLLSDRAKSAYNVWQVAALVTIGLGLMTTVLVSLSTTEFGQGPGVTQRTIRVLAVIFPALGTAAAAVVAFYGPQAEWTQSSRTLASLSQLHAQLALDLWKLECKADAAGEIKPPLKVLPKTPLLEEASKRYLEIQTVANASQGNSQNEPAQPKKPDPASKPGG